MVVGLYPWHVQAQVKPRVYEVLGINNRDITGITIFDLQTMNGISCVADPDGDPRDRVRRFVVGE
jgi:hypothetical protein